MFEHTDSISEFLRSSRSQWDESQKDCGPSDEDLSEYTDEGYMTPEDNEISTHWG